MPIKLANNASGLLATAISASDTGIVLRSGDGAEFPTLGAGDYFYATLTSTQGTQEIVKVTARVGDTMTVVRAQEGTTANGFAVGTRFELRVTAASVDDRADLAESEAIAYADGLDTTLRANLAASSGSSLVGYVQGVGTSIATTVQAKLRETASVKDFGAVGDGVTDDTAAINAARAFIGSGSGALYFPAGTYVSSSTPQVLYVGPGKVIKPDTTDNLAFINLNFGDTGKKTRRLYCIPRQDTLGSGWYALDDAGHAPNGISTLVKDGDFLKVNYNFNGLKVGHFSVTTDESFAINNIRVGSSVGTSSSLIRMSSDLDLIVNNNTLSFACQFFFQPSISVVKNVDETITVTHPASPTGNNPIIPMYDTGGGVNIGSNKTVVPIILGQTNTSFTYGIFDFLSGFIEFDGTNWVVVTNSVVKPTVTVGATTVAFDFGTTPVGNISINQRQPDTHLIFLASQSATAFSISMRDFAGVFVDPPFATTNDRFWFTSDRRVMIEPTERARFIRSNIAIDPDNMYGTFFNMWVSGEMEM